jgi:hypothetical protein
MTTHEHGEDPACAVAHGAQEHQHQHGQAAGERTLVAVFASPVAGYLLRYGADLGYRGLLLEPDEARAAAASALGFPVLHEVPEDLDDEADLVLTDHHRGELGIVLRDALSTKARWIGLMGNPRHVGPHVEALTTLGVPPTRSPGCTGRSGSTSGPGPRRRSPSPPSPGCSPTVTAGPAASSSDPASLGPLELARHHRLSVINRCH